MSRNEVVYATYMDQAAVYLNAVLVVTDCNTGNRPTPYTSPQEIARRLALALRAPLVTVVIPYGASARLNALRDWDDITKMLSSAWALGKSASTLFEGYVRAG